MPEANHLPVVRIDRAAWGRGYLYDPETKCYCGLGFTLKALGVSDELLAGQCYPTNIREQLPAMARAVFYERLFHGDEILQDWAFALSGINDFAELTAAERERQMAAVLTRAGFGVEFIN